MSDKLTLDKARELLQTRDAEIQGLNARISEYDLALTQFGIVRAEADGKVTFGSQKFSDLESKVATLEDENSTFQAAFAKADGELTSAREKISELEKKDANVSSRAREFLASQGGRPLNIAGKPMDENLSEAEISKEIAEASKRGDTEAVAKLYGQIKELRKKQK